MPAELMGRSLGDLEDARVDTMDDLDGIVNVWMAACNVLPHDVFGGRAPVERG